MSVVDDYLKNVSESGRAELERVRRIINETAPEAEEVITYGMPGFKYKKKYLIAFAEFKDHLSVFPGSAPTAELKEQLTEFKTSKGTIQFTVDKPLPKDIIQQLVTSRVKSIDAG